MRGKKMQTALITGASRGIGKKTAEVLAQNGYCVIINYNKSEKDANMLLKKITDKGGRAYLAQGDVSKSNDVKKMFNNINSSFGGVDVLVNNAGISYFGVFDLMTEEEYDRIFDVNMKAMFLCSKECAPYMINKKSGRIINISSMWGVTGASCEVAYSASKAAVIGFTKALALELAPSGITVNCIAPGVIDTDMNKNLTPSDIEELKNQTPLGKIGTPSDIANAVAFLASEKASFITGQILGVNGGLVV